MVEATCWWDLLKVIPAGTYTGCSATIMHKKRLRGIFIPNVPGYIGIFIHVGGGPDASDGCIVCHKAYIDKIWNDIHPKDGRNVTVTVIDSRQDNRPATEHWAGGRAVPPA